MHIILSGKHGSPVAAVSEALKKRWAALGTAVYIHNSKGPAQLICDAAKTVGQQFAPVPENADLDLFLEQAILDWGREQDVQFWGKITKRQVDQVTGRWEEMGLFHVTVIQGLCFKEDFQLFPRAYRVYLLPPGDYKPHMIHGHHLSETALDSWVEESRKDRYPIFDEVINPEDGSPDEIARVIFEGFNERFKSGFRTLMN